jgi:hypothetical protein
VALEENTGKGLQIARLRTRLHKGKHGDELRIRWPNKLVWTGRSFAAATSPQCLDIFSERILQDESQLQ